MESVSNELKGSVWMPNRSASITGQSHRPVPIAAEEPCIVPQAVKCIGQPLADQQEKHYRRKQQHHQKIS